MDIFAPGYHPPINGCFIIQNTSRQNKTITVFQYPINLNTTRDILQIPGVSEQDIRASLLKGELRHKILCGDIVVVCSDVDLLQFNGNQKAFLQSAGITNGLQVSSSQLSVIELRNEVLNGLVNGTNTIFTIPSGTWIQDAPQYVITVYWNGVEQLFGGDYTIAESIPGNGYDTVVMAIPPLPWNSSTNEPADVITADYYIDNSNADTGSCCESL